MLLDAGPLGMFSHPRKNPDIKVWLQNLIRSGTVVRVPEIVDYEVYRFGLPRNSNYEAFSIQFMSNSYVVPILTPSNKETALLTPARKDGTIAVLTAKDKESLIEYYSNTVQMEYQGPDTIAPGEDGHVFTFSRQAAEQFCTRQEQWGLPAPL